MLSEDKPNVLLLFIRVDDISAFCRRHPYRSQYEVIRNSFYVSYLKAIDDIEDTIILPKNKLPFDIRKNDDCIKLDIGNHIFIVGKPHGYTFEKNEKTNVVEISKYGIHMIPEYEFDKIACYIMLTKLPVLLVQEYNNEIIHRIIRPDEMEDRINILITSLYECANKIRNMKNTNYFLY